MQIGSGRGEVLARSKGRDGLWRGKGLKPQLEMGGGLLGAQMEMGAGGRWLGRKTEMGTGRVGLHSSWSPET